MEIGKEYEVDIMDISPNGEGVAKIKGFPVFVKNVKVNEHVKVRITGLMSGAADAEKVA